MALPVPVFPSGGSARIFRLRCRGRGDPSPLSECVFKELGGLLHQALPDSRRRETLVPQCAGFQPTGLGPVVAQRSELHPMQTVWFRDRRAGRPGAPWGVGPSDWAPPLLCTGPARTRNQISKHSKKSCRNQTNVLECRREIRDLHRHFPGRGAVRWGDQPFVRKGCAPQARLS